MRKPLFRIQEFCAGRFLFERNDWPLKADGNPDPRGWRTLDECDDRELAEVRLAKAEGRMTKDEVAKFFMQRAKKHRASVKAAREQKTTELWRQAELRRTHCS